MPDFGVALRGYDQREVDELFGRIEATLRRRPGDRNGDASELAADGEAGELTADGVRRITFTMVMRGYDPVEVDDALCGYLRELERRERHSSGQWRILRTIT